MIQVVFRLPQGFLVVVSNASSSASYLAVVLLSVYSFTACSTIGLVLWSLYLTPWSESGRGETCIGGLAVSFIHGGLSNKPHFTTVCIYDGDECFKDLFSIQLFIMLSSNIGQIR